MIEVGEYIRTTDGRIGKIEAIFKRDRYSDVFHTDINCDDYECKHYVYDFDIKSHSKNIIDLIEARDFVNGERVTNIMDNGIGTEMGRFIAKEHIKTILTHEQYEQNCYKVGVKNERYGRNNKK